MVRNVRNFWFEALLPGRKDVATGPKGSMERMQINLFIRCKGKSKLAFVINCVPFTGQGKNSISIFQLSEDRELLLHRMECDR